MKFPPLLVRFILIWAIAEPFLFAQAPPPTIPEPAFPPAATSSPPAAELANEGDFVEPAAAPRPRRSRRSTRTPKEAIAVASNLLVPEGHTNGDTVVVAGKAEVLGTIRGDLTVVAGSLHLGPKAEVTGDIAVVAGAFDAEPTAIQRGELSVIGTSSILSGLPWAGDWIREGIFLGRPLPPRAWWSWLLVGVILLVYLALGFLFPRAVQATVNSLAERPGTSVLAGILALAAFGPALLLLTVMIVGLPLVPLLIGALVVALVFGKIAVYSYAGQQAGTHAGVALLQKPLVALLVGAILFCLLYSIPIVGLIAWGATAIVGLGAVLVAFFNRNSPPNRPLPDLVLPAVGAASPAVVPRAGFWVRFLATLLDLVLIGLIVVPLLHRPKWFIPCWIAYHLAFWWWKGTTLGGIVLGLRIVRTNGEPVTFAVVLVRLLGSFFSAAVLCLGFFWAGWSADKQSWHDKIAGTVVVKPPAGTALL